MSDPNARNIRITHDPSQARAVKKTEADFTGVDSLGKLLDSVPALRHLLDQAIAGDWSASKFQNAVEDSAWWKSHSDTARSRIIQQANDPAAWQQSLNNVQSSITNLAHQLGMPLNSATIRAIANSALLSGNDGNQQWLTQQIGKHENYNHVTSTDGFQGGMASTVQQLEQLAGDYGYHWSPAQIARNAQQILMGEQTIDTYRQGVQKWAKSTFPGLAQEIDSGQTIKDLATPYVQSMANLLEVDPGTLTTFNPTIRKAMQGALDPATKQRAATPLWQFEDQVRQDPRWQYTQNARDTMSSALVKIGQDFGFSV